MDEHRLSNQKPLISAKHETTIEECAQQENAAGSKGMRDSLYGWMCALMLGIGQMCMYTGFDSSSFVVEPILHSVANREPGRIDTHAGYFGSAVCLLVYTFANLFAPWVLGMVGSKLTLVLASSCVTLYFLSFMYIHFIPYYLAAVLLGVGFALFYAGNGGYLTEHSSRITIERNTTLSWTLGSFCMIVGGVVMLITIKPQIEAMKMDNTTSASNETTSPSDFREFSDSDIRLMYGAFAGVAFIANFIFAVLPRRAVANSLAEVNERKHRIGLGEQLVKMGRALADHRMVQMAPAFCLVGTTTTFWISVYPTTMTFTKKLSEHVYLPAYYSLVLGSADIIMGCTIMILSKRIRNFAQMPTLVIGAVLYMAGALLALHSTPAWSTNTPNDDPTLWFEPSVHIVLLIAMLFGMADNCINTSRSVLCALCMPDQTKQVYSIAKFYQSLTASILTFIAPWMSVPAYFVLITLNVIVGVILFGRVAAKTHKNERKITEATNGEAEKIPEKTKIDDVDQ